MAEIRPAASLTSNLLARRGDARPAMRRQAITHLHVPLTAHEDLGWNDIGEEHEPLPTVTSLSGMSSPSQAAPYDDDADDYDSDYPADQPHGGMSPLSPITRHLEAIAQRLTSVARDTSTAFTPTTPRKTGWLQPRAADRKAAFTLRLDEERHLRLRLLSAVAHRSSQQLLIEALDALLASHDRVEDLAGRVEDAGGHPDEAGL